MKRRLVGQSKPQDVSASKASSSTKSNGSVGHLTDASVSGKWYLPIFVAVAFLLPLVVYLRTLNCGMAGGDWGELVVNAYQFSVPHPPGYPTFMALGWLWIHLVPIPGSVAYRINVLSAVESAGASAFLFLAICAVNIMALRSSIVRQLSRVQAATSSQGRRVGIQRRKLHTSPVSSTWLSKMRPDLAHLHPLQKPLDDPTRKEEHAQMLLWWKNANVDVMAKRISKWLEKGGYVRPGIVNILLTRAYKPEHIHAALQGITLHQVKQNVDLDQHTVVLLLRAIVRANAPQLAIDLFSSMTWIRVFPSMKEMNIVLSYFAAEAKARALKTPQMRPAPDFEADIVEPAEDALVEEEAASEEAASEESATPVDPEKLLLQQFSRFLQIISDPRFGLKLDFEGHKNVMTFWAYRGNALEASRAWAEMSKIDSAAADSYLDGIVLSYIASGDVAKAVNQLKQSPPKAAPKQNSLTNPSLDVSLRAVRTMIAVANGDASEVVSVLKASKNPFSYSYVATHFGHADRFAVIQKAYQTFSEESGTAIPDEFAEFLTKVEAHIQELAAKAAEAEKPAEEKAE
eukprot:TRINITY_DN486_c0_g1_i2.p1 TRINITY_DN486_c0_g1~~TRINITY_DN486_c0_g1_i2.p1  ORF type:complete len:573 (+),score=132.05 TRINITY_DN486_c0_g1_i2:144-1862(+)